MNLHICTISLRNDFLKKIYDSIPREEDIVWHIARSKDNAIKWVNNDSRVRLYEIDCEDMDTPVKMNYIFDSIKETDPDSYFCILDDDTYFLPTMYRLYDFYRYKKFMVIGRQQDKEGNIRLQETLPYECAIDSGNVLCHSSVLFLERWPDKHWDNKFHADFDFWDRCYKHFGITNTDVVGSTISVYNAFSEKEDSLIYKRKNLNNG